MTQASAYELTLQSLRAAPRTWLITGVAGFIGSHLLQTLLAQGQRVVGLDNFATGHWHNLSDVQTLVGNGAWANLRMIEGDICQPADCQAACQGVDYVLHQAALGSVPRSLADPATTNGVNIGGFLNMCVAARDAKVKRFVYAASSSTYGDHPGLPKIEHAIGNPLSPYAVTKYVNELYAAVFARAYGLPSIGLRYFNVFGPRQAFDSPYSGVIAKFCTALLAGRTPVIFGDGLQSRDFTYVENVVAANLLAAETPTAQVAGKVFNVAGGQSISLRQLVGELNRVLGQNIEPRFEPARAGDIRHSLADVTAIRAALGFESKISWQEGLRRTLDFYRKG